jgi:hypothetical protein
MFGKSIVLIARERLRCAFPTAGRQTCLKRARSQIANTALVGSHEEAEQWQLTVSRRVRFL